MRTVLINTPERVWNLDRDMRCWGLRERLDLLFDNGDSDNDLDSDEE